MPLTAKGKKIMASMKEQYGDRAKEVFYRAANAGTIKGVHAKKKKKKVQHRGKTYTVRDGSRT